MLREEDRIKHNLEFHTPLFPWQLLQLNALLPRMPGGRLIFIQSLRVKTVKICPDVIYREAKGDLTRRTCLSSLLESVFVL